MTRNTETRYADRQTELDDRLSMAVSADLIAARRAANAYQTCLLAAFAIPFFGLLAFAFLL